MTILSDTTILERLEEDLIINPINKNDIQPCSIDLHLGYELKNLDGLTHDLRYCPYTLSPGEFILGSTYEHIEIPKDLVAQVDGKSSIGRLGILIHVTAGWIDSNFKGNITLEIANISNKPFKLEYNMSICQLILMTLTTTVNRPYGHPELNSKYQNSKGTIASRKI